MCGIDAGPATAETDMGKHAILAVALGLSGCILLTEPSPATPGARPGDITFLWNFDGQSCADLANVIDRIVVRITRAPDDREEVLLPGRSDFGNGEYACTFGDTDGVTLQDFAPTTYHYTIQAIDVRRTVLYVITGDVNVDGSKTQRVKLAAAPTGSLVLYWKFNGMGCAAARVSRVRVSLNNSAPVEYDCVASNTVEGGVVAPVSSNTTYQVRLDGIEYVNSQPLIYFSAVTSANIGSGGETRYPVDLPWAASALVIAWRFSNAADCSAARVESVWFRLRDALGRFVGPSGSAGDFRPCTNTSYEFPYLFAGVPVGRWVPEGAGGRYEADYALEMKGYNTAGEVTYKTSANVVLRADAQPRNVFPIWLTP